MNINVMLLYIFYFNAQQNNKIYGISCQIIWLLWSTNWKEYEIHSLLIVCHSFSFAFTFFLVKILMEIYGEEMCLMDIFRLKSPCAPSGEITVFQCDLNLKNEKFTKFAQLPLYKIQFPPFQTFSTENLQI